jgi:hypothetical protein
MQIKHNPNMKTIELKSFEDSEDTGLTDSEVMRAVKIHRNLV